VSLLLQLLRSVALLHLRYAGMHGSSGGAPAKTYRARIWWALYQPACQAFTVVNGYLVTA
jgi:hypothetical protein